MRALSKKREDRFPSIREFARAFDTAAVVTPGSQTVLSGSQGQHRITPAPIPPPSTERARPAPTTFSHAAAELTRPLLRLKQWMGRSFWGAAAGLGALVVIVPIIAHRSGHTTAAPQVLPPSAEVRSAAPAVRPPSAPPPPIVAPIDPSASATAPKTEPSQATHVDGEPKKRRAAHWVDPFAETAPSQKASRTSTSGHAKTPSAAPPTAPAKAKHRLIKEL